MKILLLERFIMNEIIDKLQSQKIFLYLKDGKFLSQNSPKKDERKLFEYVDRNFEDLKDIYEYVGVNLVLKNGYCYFSSLENKELKLKIIYEILDILSFFHHFNPFFDVNLRFTLQEIHEKVIDDITLKVKLDKIKNLSDDTLANSIKSLVLRFEKRGFIACEDEYLQKYIVLDSISYLNEFFAKIEIKE